MDESPTDATDAADARAGGADAGEDAAPDAATATDAILIRDLLVRGIIGVHGWEREKKQDIVINLELAVDVRPAAETDDLRRGLDYRALAKRVIAHAETAEPQLVETLAHEVARIAVVEFGAAVAKVRVEKPGALRFARSVGVEVARRAEDFA